MSNDYGPTWTVNSEEVGGALIGIIAAICAPVAPLIYLGYYIGDKIINMNIAKWGLAGLFFLVGYLVLIWLREKKGFFASFLFIVMEYLVLDSIVTQHDGRDELYSLTIIKELINWAISNT